ncbi:MAG: TonB-dependent receptor [Massilibacteroides sp.]|nr:TonB-dependent receptor [Massilibacteroides sp.]MDD3063064.1 TonB-dependent receptor [Massilibacteroides sp.]MDD4114282.1 TonB-dependent receptor [Massilibacteroides sp.]MDD4660379.1 TonB-dependent receptor [Massilibacteroides sp.]
MKRCLLFVFLFVLLCDFGTLWAEEPVLNDTIKTFTVDEIVITSSTKETNQFRYLPTAASILSPQTIGGRQIESVKDLSFYVPNLYMPDYGSKYTSAIYIRGIGARSSGQSIGLYVDDMPYQDKSTFDFELMDIQRIEVLRGPQGTLYGRNAMSGIINIYTLSPFLYQGTKLSVGGGNYGLFKAHASHYAKLTENVGLSVGGYYDRNDGFFTNQFDGKEADEEESAGGRLKLEWLIRPNLTLRYGFNMDYTDQGAFPYRLYDPVNDVLKPVNYNDRNTYTRTMLTNNLQLLYRGQGYALTSTTGYQYFKDNMWLDQDFTDSTMFTLNQKQKQHAISEELALKSMTSGNYQWSFGAYGFYNDLHTEGPVTFKADGIRYIFQSVFDRLKEENPKMPQLKVLDDELAIPGTFETPSYGGAVYHESTYNNLFADGLSLTAGLRLDYEKQEMTYRSEGLMRLGMSMGSGMPVTELPGQKPSVVDEHITHDFWQLLPRISLKYACTDRTFTYFSVAKGYKAGGYNVQMSADYMQGQMQYDLMSKYMPAMAVPPTSIDSVAAYKPEQSWNYEFGIRSELIENVLKAELTLFYMDIKDIQLTKFVNSGNGRILTNAGKAESYGVELSVQANLLPGLNADLNYGYTHATFRDYNDGKVDYEGHYVPYTPRQTFSIGMNYSRLLSSGCLDQVTASVQYGGAGKIYWTEQNDMAQSFYGTLNMKVGVRKENLRLDLWGRNLTDKDYAVFYFYSRGNSFLQQAKPVQFGADITWLF